MTEKTVLMRIKISAYPWKGKTRYLAEVEEGDIIKSHNTGTLRQLAKDLKEMIL